MTRDRGTGQYEPKLIESDVRSRYESRIALQKHDFIYGSHFSTGSLQTDVPAGSSTDILIQNPSDSGQYILCIPDYTSTGRSTVQKFINVSVTSTGPSIPVVQRRSDFSNSTAVYTATESNTVDKTNARAFPERLATTSSGENSGGSIVHAKETLIAPGDNLCIVFENISARSVDVTIYVELIEVPESVMEAMTER